MTIQRGDHVGVVADDLEAVIVFLVELGLELEGRTPVSGPRVDAAVGGGPEGIIVAPAEQLG